MDGSVGNSNTGVFGYIGVLGQKDVVTQIVEWDGRSIICPQQRACFQDD